MSVLKMAARALTEVEKESLDLTGDVLDDQATFEDLDEFFNGKIDLKTFVLRLYRSRENAKANRTPEKYIAEVDALKEYV